MPFVASPGEIGDLYDDRNLKLTPIAVVGLVFGLAAAIAVMLLAMPALIDGAQNLANLIN